MPADTKQAHVAREFVHGAPLITCRFDPKSRYVFATGEDRAIIRWDLASGAKTEFKAHDSWVRAMVFSTDGQFLVTAGCDDMLMWWPVAAEKPEPVRKVKAHNGWIRAVAVSADGQFLASAGNDRIVKLWKMADGAPVREMPGHEKDIYSLQFHPSGLHLLSADLKGTVHQWEVATGKLVRTFDAKDLYSYNGGQGVDFGGVRSLALGPGNKHLACGGLYQASNPLGAVHEPIVLRFDWESQKVLKKHVSTDIKNGVIWRTLFLPDGMLVGCSGGGAGGILLFWGENDEKPMHQFKLPDTAREMDLHPDGLQLATVHYDKKLIITKLAPKEAPKEVKK